MRILFVATKYDYGIPGQGYSHQYTNHYGTLIGMGNDIVYFDFSALLQKHGREKMNRMLYELATSQKFDMLFAVISEEEIDREVMQKISKECDYPTFNWFTDDHWRFESYTCHWAPCFNWCSTTDSGALRKYRLIRYGNVIKSQWACNHFHYQKLGIPLEHDVTFVGLPHSGRRGVVQKLHDAGIDVKAWGKGWDDGRIDQDRMIRVFNQSRINLNFSDSPADIPEQTLKKTVVQNITFMLRHLPYGMRLKEAGKELLGRISPDLLEDAPGDAGGEGRDVPLQIKGRDFEVTGCGGFLMTGRADNLHEYFDIGREVVAYDDSADLLEKVRYYLRHEDERARIAEAGFERTMREHTFAHRFVEIFDRIGLPHEPLDHVLNAGRISPGRTEDVS